MVDTSFFYCVSKKGHMNFECPVCFDGQLDEVEHIWCVLPCTHHICLNCLVRLPCDPHIRCPMCRREMTQSVPEQIRGSRVLSLNIQTDIDDRIFETIMRRQRILGRPSNTWNAPNLAMSTDLVLGEQDAPMENAPSTEATGDNGSRSELEV